MTSISPAEDKSLWSAAKSLYNADRLRHNRDGLGWPAWDQAGRETRERYRQMAQRAVTPSEVAEEAIEARQAIPVTCEVTIPLASVTDMVRVLQDVPVTARLSLRTQVVDYQGQPGIRILSQDELDRTRPRIVAVWEESR